MIRRERNRAVRLLVLATSLSVACGGTDRTEPVDANLEGSWDYTASNLISGQYNCGVSGTILVLHQSGKDLTGQYRGGSITCFGGAGGGGSTFIDTGAIAFGTVSINQVAFNFLGATFGPSDWTNAGTIAGDIISGSTVLTLRDGATVLVLSGTFKATRR